MDSRLWKCFVFVALLSTIGVGSAYAEGPMVPFPIGGGYTVLGGDLADLFPGTNGTIHYSIGGGWDFVGFDLGVKLVFLENPDGSPWVSGPVYGAIGPGFFFDIPLDGDSKPAWHLTLRGRVNVAWIGVMYDVPDSEYATEKVLMYGPSVETGAQLSYDFGYGFRIFTEVSNEWSYLQNASRGRFANGYMLHMTAGIAMGFDMFSW